MVDQEELPYTSSSGWESWPSDFSSGMSDTFGGRDMQIAGLEPINSTYRNHEIIINRQLSTLHGQADEDFQAYRLGQRRLRRINRDISRLNLTQLTPSTIATIVRLRNERQTLEMQIERYEDFIESGGFYSDDDIIN